MNESTEQFGDMFKRLRLASGQSLRSFCLSHNFDPGNVSRIERGRVGPPDTDEILTRFAGALGLLKESSEWKAFMDTAYLQKGKIPKDMMSDEELMGALPLLFRTIRENQDGKQALRDFAEELRRL